MDRQTDNQRVIRKQIQRHR